QRRTTTGIGQATAGELLGLSGIALSQTNLGKTIKHLRLTRRDALGTLQTGSGAIEIATTLLLLGGSQQRENRAIQLLVGSQAAATGNTAGHARGRRCR